MKRLILLMLVAAPAFGWGEKGHLLVNEAATFGTPNELPPFFHKAYARLTYLGPEPDRWYTGRFKSIYAANFPEHFLNYEFVAHLELPASRYEFINLLYTSGTLKRFGISNSTPGFAPWRIAELCELLTVQFRLWRNSDPGVERQQIEENIIHIAGILGHSVGDISNPHHTTIHYNGWVGRNPDGYRFDCETHERFEHRFVTRTMALRDVLPHMRAPKQETEYFAAAMSHIRESNALLDELYRLDRDGALDSNAGTPEARAFAAKRIAAGASMLRDLWWSAYRNSARPLADWRTN